MDSTEYDVAIIGGGPAGSTAGCILKKYDPNLRVVLFEREAFPRDHIGESLLPVTNLVLNEIGAWDKVEAANFPVKVGATYRWGSKPGLWDFEFLPAEQYEDKPRPGKFEGQRQRTSFQVDRSIYDQILLDHAREFGVEVHEQTQVQEIEHEDGRVTGLQLKDGSRITSRYTIDASGNSGLLRRTLGIEAITPTNLKNLAFYDYWEDAEWAVTVGASGTRIQVMSLGWGWIWFIPIQPTRTSIGLVVPSQYYKKTGKTPEELYMEALESEPRISVLLKNAKRENNFTTTKDWSFLSEKMAGENWFLIGEAAGFADPILSAGVTLAHMSAREAAYTIMELDRGILDGAWLRDHFAARQKRRISHHIRFADYWYTANEQFTDLIEFTSEIAKDAGLSFDGSNAWQWLGTGGFVDEEVGGAGFGGYSLGAVKRFVDMFSHVDDGWSIAKNNVFILNLGGAKQVQVPNYSEGRIVATPAYKRGDKVLPAYGVFDFIVKTLKKSERVEQIVGAIRNEWAQQAGPIEPTALVTIVLQTLEAMINDGWVETMYLPDRPLMDINGMAGRQVIHDNRDNRNLQLLP